MEEKKLLQVVKPVGAAMVRAQKRFWDRPISPKLAEEFHDWYEPLNLLLDFQVDRCTLTKSKTTKTRLTSE